MIRLAFALVALAVLASDVNDVSPATIGRAVLLGQAYRSGNLYLKAFGDEDDVPPWPPRVVVKALRLGASGVSPTLHASVSGLVEPAPDGAANFRDREGRPAGERVESSADFFRTMEDSPLNERSVAVYLAESATAASFQVIAFDVRLPVGAIDYSRRGERRPLTAIEQKELDEEKATAKQQIGDADCTTVPAFLDSARELLRADIEGTPFWIRLSEYANPGCAGHLSEVYILDVMEHGREPRRFVLRHYVGVI